MTVTAAAAVEADAAKDAQRVWVIERDGTHSPGTLVNRASVWPGACRVRRESDTDSVLWERRNVIDHASGERLR